MKIAAMVTNSREKINSCQYFPILSYFLTLRIFSWRSIHMATTQIGKKIGGHRACLGDIMQNIAKIRGKPGASFTIFSD